MFEKLTQKLKSLSTNRGEENGNRNLPPPPVVDGQHAADTSAIDMRDVKISSETKSPSQTCRSTFGLFENDQGEPPQDTRHLWETRPQSGEIFNLIEVAELWDAAYDNLAVEEPELIAHYENLVSTSWNIQEVTNSGLQHLKSVKLMKNGTDRPLGARVSKRRGSLINALDTALANNSENGRQNSTLFFLFNKLIRTMSRQTPKAVLVWVAVYFSAQNLLNADSVLQPDFFTHARILLRIDCYCNLATLRLGHEAVEDHRSFPSHTWSNTKLKDDWIMLCRIILLRFIKIACMDMRECRNIDLSSDQLERDITRQEDILISSVSGDQAQQELSNFLATIGKICGKYEPGTPPSIGPSSSDDQDDDQRDLISMDSKLLDSIISCKSDSRILKHMESWAMSINQYTTFRRWDPNTSKRSLWVNGAPGYGKTNLLLAMANELLERKKEDSNAPNVAYCSCTCGNIIRGKMSSVIHQLTQQVVRDQPLVAQSLEDQELRHYFDTPPDFATVFSLLKVILRCEELLPTYLILNGLDELIVSGNAEAEELHELLGLILEKTQPLNTKVQWLISVDTDFFTEHIDSTYNDRISSITLGSSNVENGLAPALREAAALEVNALLQDFNIPSSFGTILEEILLEKSRGNFLWLKLACKIIKFYRAPWNARGILDKLGGSVSELYEYSGITLDSLPVDDPKTCKKILLTMTAAYGPLSISELRVLADVPLEVDLEKMITRHCSCFLEFQEEMVYFAHPSAMAYLRQRNTILKVNSETHLGIALRSLNLLVESLQEKTRQRRYRLGGSGALRKTQYASLNWVQHFTQLNGLEEIEELVNRLTFFLEAHLIQWLDAVTPMYRVSDIVTDFERLECCLTDNLSRRSNSLRNCVARVRDATQFLRFHNHTHTPANFSANNTKLFYPSNNDKKSLLLRSEFPWLSNMSSINDNSELVMLSFQAHAKQHYTWIFSCACSPDGQFVATSSDDGTAKVWGITNGNLVYTLRPPTEGAVDKVTFSSSGYLATISNRLFDVTVNLWEPLTYILANTFTMEKNRDKCKSNTRSALVDGNFLDSSFSPDGKKLATGTNQAFMILSVPSFEKLEIQTGAGLGKNTCLKFFKNNGIAIGSDKCISIWNIEDGSMIRTFGTNAEGLAFSSNYGILASHSDNGEVKLWNPDSGNSIGTLSCFDSRIISLTFSFDDTQLATASDNGAISIWDLKTKGIKAKPSLTFKEAGLKSIQFSAKQHLLASVSRYGYLRVRKTCSIDIDPNSQSGIITAATTKTQTQAQYYPIDFVTFSLDGGLIAAASKGGVVSIWDGDTGEHRASLTGQSENVLWLQFSYDGSMLASSCPSGVISVWNVQDGSLLRTLKGHKNWVRRVQFSMDNRKLASVSDDGTTRVWKINLKKNSGEAWENDILNNGPGRGTALAFSSTGTHLASEANDGFRVFDLTKPDISGTEEFLPKNIMVSHTIAFLPDREDTLLSAGESLKIWNIKSRTCVRISTSIPKGFLSMELSCDFPGYIFTEIGTYYVGDILVSPPLLPKHDKPAPKEIELEGMKSKEVRIGEISQLLTLEELSLSPYGLNPDRSVITWKNKDLIFLPERYRPYKQSAYGNCRIWNHGRKIAIGCESGQVLLFNFAVDKDPAI